jgi:hypothetical protein
MTQKSINWSYPSSTNANKFGFKAGCWTVSVGEQSTPPIAIAGFATAEQAVQFALTLPEPWSRWQLHAPVQQAMSKLCV